MGVSSWSRNVSSARLAATTLRMRAGLNRLGLPSAGRRLATLEEIPSSSVRNS